MAKFLLSKKVVINQYNEIKRLVDVVSYSYKTNPEVGDVLQKEDCFFSINSFNSIKRIKRKERIFYFLQGESENEIETLFNQKISHFVVDNEVDLTRLLNVLNKQDSKITLFLRIKLKEHTIYTGKFFVYGFDWKKANEIIKDLNKNDKIEKIGIHVHRKTQNIGEWDLINDFRDALSDETFSMIDYIDIGGGLPWSYANSSPNLDLIKNKILEFKAFINKKGVKLVAEPGRYICAPAVRLIAKVINVYDSTIILDCSIFNAYMDTFLYNIKLPVLNEKKKGIKYLLKGRSPDSLDIFRYQVFFEKEVNVNDEIVFLNAGAYNFYTEFNDFDRLKTEIVEDFEN